MTYMYRPTRITIIRQRKIDRRVTPFQSFLLLVEY